MVHPENIHISNIIHTGQVIWENIYINTHTYLKESKGKEDERGETKDILKTQK